MIGFSNPMSASIRRPCGKLPGPGGFLRKSPMSLPAQNASPAPCQSTTRTASSLPASPKISASLVYMSAVIAFFFAGRFSSTRRMLPERSVLMSLIVCLVVPLFSDWLGRPFLCFRHGPACAQGIDVLRAKSQLAEDLFVVLAEIGGAPGRDLGDTVHLNRAADRGAELGAGAFERNDDVVCRQLGILDHLLRPEHGAEVTCTPPKTSFQCVIGCAAKTSSRMALSCSMFTVSFGGSENRGSVRRSGRPIAFATAANLSGVTMRTNQVPSAARYTLNAAFAGFLRSCGA